MKRVWQIGIAVLTMTVMMGMVAYAGSWQESFRGKWWKNDDGSYPTSGWHWIDWENDGFAECFYFDENGYALVNTTTPDGYLVNENGEWYIEESVTRTVDSYEGLKEVPGVIRHIQKQRTDIQGSVSYMKEERSELLIGTMVSPNSEDWNFYLHVPKNVTENMPMIVVFHDRGGGPGPITTLKNDPMFRYIMEHEEIRESALILFPKYQFLKADGAKYKDVVHNYARMIQLVVKDFPVDTNRIYATGGSMGSSGTFHLCNDYPELVACGVALTGWPQVNPASYQSYTDIPIWFIVEDEKNIIDATNTIVRMMVENGASAWVTVDTGTGHSTVGGITLGIDKFGIFDWMFTQKKN